MPPTIRPPDFHQVRAITRQSHFAFQALLATQQGRQNFFTERTFYPICRWWQDYLVNRAGARLHVKDPRNHIKSTVARRVPLFLAIQQPIEALDSEAEFERAQAAFKARPWLRGHDSRFLYASASKKNAAKKVLATRHDCELNPGLRLYWPELTKDWFAQTEERRRAAGARQAYDPTWNQEAFELPERRTFTDEVFLQSAGVTSASTTLHFDGIFFDDPINEDNWKSEPEIQRAIEWLEFQEMLLEVADPTMPNASFAVEIGNPWNFYDVSAYIEANLKRYVVWHRSCWVCSRCGRNCCERTIDCEKTDEPLWPERWSRDALLALKAEQPRNFAAQYECDPMTGDVVAFDNSKIRSAMYNGADNEVVLLPTAGSVESYRVPLGALRGVISVDPASSTDPRSCRTAIHVLAEDRATQMVYVLDTRADQFGPRQSITETLDLFVKWRQRGLSIVHIGIEKVGGQAYFEPALVSEARARGLYMIQPCAGQPHDLVQFYVTDTRERKEDRITRLLGWRIEAGLLAVDRTVPRAGLLLEEIERFPVGRTNDLIDALAYAEQIYTRSTSSREDAQRQRKAIRRFQWRGRQALV